MPGHRGEMGDGSLVSPPLSSSPSSCSLPGTNPAGSFRGPSRLDGGICDDCESVALQSRVLKQHKESPHEGLMYSCAACDHFVPRVGVLKQHNGSKSVGLSGLHSLRARSRPAWLLLLSFRLSWTGRTASCLNYALVPGSAPCVGDGRTVALRRT